MLDNTPLPRFCDLIQIQGLEDGLIVEVRKSNINQRLSIILRCGYVQMGYYDLWLAYSDVIINSEDEPMLSHIARTTVDEHNHEADLCRQEINLSLDGMIEHRLEFYVFNQPNVTVVIRCRDLQWNVVTQPSRKLPNLPERFLVDVA